MQCAKMWMWSPILVTVIGAVTFFVTSCGTPVCVGGLRGGSQDDCGFRGPGPGTNKTGPQGGSNLVFIGTSVKPQIQAGTTIRNFFTNYTLQGVTGEPTYIITSPSATYGTVNKSGDYAAPAGATTPQIVRVKLCYAQNCSIELPFVVTPY
jgi:hypothetical protein